ncbi:MAG: CHASE2 domain-containing protein [Candidatus Omnitrophica bacterium]|nr:CHASE2 domain-containing protein [Candidatus Omnitrophota bacterium]
MILQSPLFNVAWARLKTFFNPPVVLAAGIVVFVFSLHAFHAVNFRELDAVDLKFRLRGRHPAHHDILLVTIDDDSLHALGTWPWPRRTHAVFLDIISRFKPHSVFFDVLFLEEGPIPLEDEMLRTAIEKAGNVILPFFYGSEKPFRAMFPIETLRKVTAGIGYINPVLDSDGRIRRFKAFLETDEGTFFYGAVRMVFRKMKTDEEIKQALARLSLDSDHRLWIDYPGSMDSFRVVSFREVMEAAMNDRVKELRDLIANRIVIVGHTATGTSMIDVKPTPFAKQEPGVLVLASALHTLLSDSRLREVPARAHVLILAVLAAIASVITLRTKPLHGLLAIAGVAAVYSGFNVLLFIFPGWIVPLNVPLIVMLLTYFGTLFLKHMEMRIQREVAERELLAASQIQERFLPQERPETKNLDVAFECRFCKGVGGDLFDWIDLGQGRYGFCVGDVSGKGIPAAIYMSKCVSDFRSIPKSDLSPGELCSTLNYILTRTQIANMFVTFAYVVVDMNLKKIVFCNGGHEAPVLYCKRTGTADFLKDKGGPPLGIFEDVEYATSEYTIEEGDMILLVSDGVKELRNGKKQEFGLERIRKTMELLSNKGVEAKGIIEGLFQAMHDFRQDNPPGDDRTLLCVRFVSLQDDPQLRT